MCTLNFIMSFKMRSVLVWRSSRRAMECRVSCSHLTTSLVYLNGGKLEATETITGKRTQGWCSFPAVLITEDFL